MLKQTMSAALVALLAAPAAAQGFDTDADARVDRDEFAAGMEERRIFDDLDTNDDGFLDESELSAATYNMMDRDNDGRVTTSEWDTWVEEHARDMQGQMASATVDADADEIITPAEFEAASERAALHGGYDVNADTLYDERESLAAMFDGFDLDADGLLDDQEFLIDDFGL